MPMIVRRDRKPFFHLQIAGEFVEITTRRDWTTQGQNINLFGGFNAV